MPQNDAHTRFMAGNGMSANVLGRLVLRGLRCAGLVQADDPWETGLAQAKLRQEAAVGPAAFDERAFEEAFFRERLAQAGEGAGSEEGQERVGV